MNANRKAKRDFLKNMRTIAEYNTYVDSLKLTDEQKQIMYMVFVKGYDYNFIADTMGISEASVKNKMRKILDKI